LVGKEYKGSGFNEFKDDRLDEYCNGLPADQRQSFRARHAVRKELGANSEFTGTGLTQSRKGSTKHGIVESLSLEKNPPPVSKMKNVKTISLKGRA